MTLQEDELLTVTKIVEILFNEFGKLVSKDIIRTTIKTLSVSGKLKMREASNSWTIEAKDLHLVIADLQRREHIPSQAVTN